MMKLYITLLYFVLCSSAFAADIQVELTTSMGTITIEVYPEKAPRTVENFLQYVKDGQYAGTIFHRVIRGFMIQTGGFNTDFVEKRTRAPIKNEANNGLKNVIGAVAMARKADPDSASAQFYINVANNPALDYRGEDNWGYAVFGKVINGMDVVEKIAQVETGPGPRPYQDVPRKPIVIKAVNILAQPKPAATKK
jgi:peptidyl-prolyl cis-trans isomerase A (cyclophilin A)